MGTHNKSEAYDLSRQPEYISPSASVPGRRSGNKAQKNKVISIEQKDARRSLRRKRNPVHITVTVLLTAVVACMLLLTVQGGVTLNELTRNIQNEKKLITEQENLEVQLKLQLETEFPPSKVQEYAEEQLGMTKAKMAQKSFVMLSENNKGVVVRDEKTGDVLGSIIDAFRDVIS